MIKHNKFKIINKTMIIPNSFVKRYDSTVNKFKTINKTMIIPNSFVKGMTVQCDKWTKKSRNYLSFCNHSNKLSSPKQKQTKKQQQRKIKT